MKKINRKISPDLIPGVGICSECGAEIKEIQDLSELKEIQEVDTFIIKNARYLLCHKEISPHEKRLLEQRFFFIKREVGYKLRRAVKTGQINKPNRCSKCGLFYPPGKILGHHENYNKPFDVIWLCSECHLNLDHSRIFP